MESSKSQKRRYSRNDGFILECMFIKYGKLSTKKTNTINSIRIYPLWKNDEDKEKKTELNKVKKVFKKISTPSILI